MYGEVGFMGLYMRSGGHSGGLPDYVTIPKPGDAGATLIWALGADRTIHPESNSFSLPFRMADAHSTRPMLMFCKES